MSVKHTCVSVRHIWVGVRDTCVRVRHTCVSVKHTNARTQMGTNEDDDDDEYDPEAKDDGPLALTMENVIPASRNPKLKTLILQPETRN